MNERKFFLITLIAVFGTLALLMVMPFFSYIVGAAILAFVLKPVHRRLSSYLPRRPAAILVVLFGLAVVIVPSSYAALAIFEDAQGLDASFEEAMFIDLGEIEDWVQEVSGQEIDLRQNLQDAAERFVNATLGNFSQMVRVLADITIGLSLMVFLMYYLLVDGNHLVNWMRDVMPLPEEIQNQLFEGIHRTTRAVIKGHVLVAIIQGLLAGLGLMLTGVPNYAFWTFIMVILAFIPIIGTFMVWGPAAAYLFLIGEPVMGLLLALYGLVIVGLADNFLRPYAVDRGANLHPATILIGVLGGVYLFSAAGLFIGPIILGILKSVLLVFKNSYEDL